MTSRDDRVDSSDSVAHLSDALGTLDGTLIARLAARTDATSLPAGAILFREGDPSDAMYVVVRGALRVTIGGPDQTEVVVGRIGPGEPVGEMQILSGGKRTATVTAADDTELARVPRAAVEDLARETPDVMRQLTAAVRRRVRRNQLVGILPSFFGPLDEAMLRDVEASTEWMELPRGATLFAQGDEGDRAYIVVSGRLQAIVHDAAGVDKVVGEIEHGEMVGEMAIFTGEPRSATVRALRDSELVSLERPAFERLIAAYPQAMMALTRLTINRLRNVQSGTRPPNRTHSIGVLAAGPDVPLTTFTRALARALDAIGPTLHVSAAELDRRLGTPGLAQVAPDDPRAARIATWIDEQEMRYRFLVLEGDATQSHWSQRCTRQADRLLVVGRAGDDPEPGPAERELLAPDGGVAGCAASLVLLHPAGTRLPSGTARWLAPRHLVRHHHVRADEPGDVTRVARFVAGTAFGVALSGGGARGFAHVGALQAFTEAGIPIDMIGGTSMGAFISAEYALGWDPPTMVRQNQTIFGPWRRDITFPILSILGGHGSNVRLRAALGDTAIEDLWLPYFCVSSNLSRAKMVIHRDGMLWLALRASAGLPGILPPVVQGGDLLVDGGFLRNLPADIVRDLAGGGTTFAVDVSAETDLQFEHPYEDAISGWRILWSRLNPFARRLATPSLAAVVQRSSEIASLMLQREALLGGIDLYIRLPVQRFGMLDFEAAPEIIETGYATTRAKLAEWLAARGTPQPDATGAREQHERFEGAIAEVESA